MLTIAIALAALLAPAAHAHDRRSAARPSLASLPVLPAASAAPDAPDLRIALPSVRYTGQVASVYVDAYERPGRLLYRFDALIQNTGGALDVFGGRAEVRQKVWLGGEPTTAPEPDAPAPGQSENRTATGATFDYVHEVTHEHWHFFSAARGSCSGTLEARIAGRRAGRVRYSGLAAGRTRTVTLRLKRPATRRLVRLRATVRDALGPGRNARRTAEGHLNRE